MKKIIINEFPDLDYLHTEALNSLCTNLSYCGDNKIVMLTSRYAGEGKSYLSMNLARTYATFGKRVCMIDADLRCSCIEENFDLTFPGEKKGLSQYLAGMCKLKDIVYETNIENFFMVPVGQTVTSSLRLLNSKNMDKIFDYCRENYDLVIVDTSPMGMIVDALDIAKYCDGALLVVSYQRGKKKEIVDAVQTIQNTGCEVLGTVLNNVSIKALTSNSYYYSKEKYLHEYGDHYNMKQPVEKKSIFRRR